MAEVLARVSGPPSPWVVTTDADGALTIMLSSPIVVQYSTGGSDTVVAGVPAAECPLDPAFTWCPYMTVGDPTLHAQKESELGAIAGDFSVLAHVYQHHVAPHQPGSLAGAPAALEFLIDGGGEVITTGVQGRLVVPFACTLLAVDLLADQSGDIVVDMWMSDYAGYPPSSGDSITAAAPPTISSDVKSQDTTLTGWTTSFSVGAILVFSVTSVRALEQCTLSLLVRR